jgi:uncharacterized UBP type Zn finger protein
VPDVTLAHGVVAGDSRERPRLDMPEFDDLCPHLEAAASRRRGVHPGTHGCEECLAMGGEWVHLRLCLTCGHVGCCDQSPNRHATRHHHETRHPVVRSYEPDEAWAYCYPHDLGVEAIPFLEGEATEVHVDPPARSRPDRAR